MMRASLLPRPRSLSLPKLGIDWPGRLGHVNIAWADVFRLPAGWPHALRTLTAALLALFLAYVLELDNPQSAAVTVLIVAHPVHGMVLNKSLYRFGGTVIGGVVAVVLMGLFAQSPEMFLFGLGIWMAICTAASTLLRNYRSYGAVLAGYTVVLIAMPAVDNPDALYHLAASRVAVIALGITCSGWVASLLTARGAEKRLHVQFRQLTGDLSRFATQSLTDRPPALAPARRRLAAEISALDSQVEFAATEDGQTGRLSDDLRAAIIAMFGVLTAASSLNGALDRLTESAHDRLAPWRRRMEDLLDAVTVAALAAPTDPARLDRITALCDDLKDFRRHLENGLVVNDLPILSAQDQMCEVLDGLILMLDGLAALVSGQPGTRPQGRIMGRAWFHADPKGAALNAVRVAVAVWIAGFIWLETAWPLGWAMLAMIVPNAGLLAMRDRPARDALVMAGGVALSTVLAWLYLLFILPAIDGFPLLAISLSPVLFSAALLMINPRLVFVGVGLGVFFLTLLTPTNPMVYDPSFFLNNALATCGGAVITAGIYRMIPPMDPRRQVRDLIQAIRHDLLILLRATGKQVSRHAWETRMHDRLLRLGGRLRAAELNRGATMRGGFAALRIGREIMKIRGLMAPVTVSGPRLLVLEAEAAIGPARAALVQMNPRRTVAIVREAAQRLQYLAQDQSEQQHQAQAAAMARAAASLFEIALLTGRYRRFLAPGQTGAEIVP